MSWRQRGTETETKREIFMYPEEKGLKRNI